MSEETGAAADIAETDDNAPDPVVEKATRMGWKGPEGFKGDPKDFIDAKTFVERGEQILPIVQANNKKLERALDAAKEQIAELTRTTKEFRTHYSTVEKRAYEKAKADLEDRLGQAAEFGDVDRVKAVSREIADLEKQASKVAEEPKAGDPLDPVLLKAFDAWREENPWFDADPDMGDWAKAVGQRLERQGMSPREMMVEVAKRARTTFPHKFTNPRRSDAAAVEAGGAPRRSAGKGYSDLPADARAICDDFVKSKILTREQYVKDYFAQ